jgi:hypothetical protein
LVLSVVLALEYESQCMLAEHRLAAALTQAQVGIFVDGLIALAEPVQSFSVGDLSFVTLEMNWCLRPLSTVALPRLLRSTKETCAKHELLGLQ